MKIDEMKRQLCTYGSRLYARGLVSANDGNLSMRLAREEFLCTPTWVSKGFMAPADICRVNLAGRRLSGKRAPTSELALHLAIYRARPDVNAVIHCHPPHAIAFAMTGQPIPTSILPEIELFLGDVPTVPYATPGTPELADAAAGMIEGASTLLLANHGTVSYGPDLKTAWFRAEMIDAYCQALLLARQLGPIRRLTAKQLADLGALEAVWASKIVPRKK